MHKTGSPCEGQSKHSCAISERLKSTYATKLGYLSISCSFSLVPDITQNYLRSSFFCGQLKQFRPLHWRLKLGGYDISLTIRTGNKKAVDQQISWSVFTKSFHFSLKFSPARPVWSGLLDPEKWRRVSQIVHLSNWRQKTLFLVH